MTDVDVKRVVATVELESSMWTELARTRETDGGGPRPRVQVSGNPEDLSLHVSLGAEDAAGQRVDTPGRDFGLRGPRRGVWHRWHGPALPEDRAEAERLALFEHRVDIHDIEDGINQMLGRDPELHRPPRLAWRNLIRALEQAGIQVTEDELIVAPLTIELAPEVRAELDRPD
jgi:hypothetical protein